MVLQVIAGTRLFERLGAVGALHNHLGPRLGVASFAITRKKPRVMQLSPSVA